MKLFHTLILCFLFAFISCGKGSTTVYNPQPTNDKKTKNIFIDPLKDGQVTIRMNLEAFGGELEELSNKRFDVIINNGELKFLDNKPIDYFDESRNLIIYIVKPVKRNSKIDILIYDSDGTVTVYSGIVSEEEIQELEGNENSTSFCATKREICDNFDNDCDGQIDEDLSVINTNCGVGACRSEGTESCQNGQIINSCQASRPTQEICDNIDNDCDGQTDEADACYLKFSSVKLGSQTSCGLTIRNKIWCWGNDSNGELGNSLPNQNSEIPIQITHTIQNPEPLNITPQTFSTGESHSCLIDQNQEAWCWGLNIRGQVGKDDNNIFSYSSPQKVFNQIPGLNERLKFLEISAGGFHTCGIQTPTQEIWCWGDNQFGQLGNGEFNDNPERQPVKINHQPLGQGQENLQFIKVSAGNTHTCAITNQNEVWCWGIGLNGELGDGLESDSNIPVKVTHENLNGNNNILSFIEISAGGNHSCGLTSQKEIWCWGATIDSRRGGPDAVESNVPVKINHQPIDAGQEELKFLKLVNGRRHTCALSTANDLWCWGDNEFGQIGNGNDNNIENNPEKVINQPFGLDEEALKFIDLSLGFQHSCALSMNQDIWCWGRDQNGGLGNGDLFNDSSIPGRVVRDRRQL